MRRFRLIPMLLLVPGLATLATVSGCGGGGNEQKASPDGGGKKAGGGAGKKPGVPTAAVDSTGWGTIKGKVTYEGTPPEVADEKITKQEEVCKCKDAEKRGATKDPTWKVGGGDHGVANVVVWVRAPDGKYFKIPDDQKERKDTVQLGQPFCAFEPHVMVLYPSYFDPATKKQQETGQKFEAINNATIPHNTDWNSGDALGGGGSNRLLQPRDTLPIPVEFSRPKAAGAEPIISFKCDIHGWMRAYARVFDHPFVGLTKGDKEAERAQSGQYEIKEVPAGVDLDVYYWHESFGDTPKKCEKKINVKKGETFTLDLKVSK
ncbi:MAG TPA: hypothetical protein VG013_42900 [Gemmataceae bacterium]|jgi:hypothetical protein|nr:hypothetical protein [Gemmataceae bacterium]